MLDRHRAHDQAEQPALHGGRDRKTADALKGLTRSKRRHTPRAPASEPNPRAPSACSNRAPSARSTSPFPTMPPASGRDCALCSKIRRPLVEIARYVACGGRRLLARVRARISDLGFCNRVCRQRIRFARFGPMRCYTSAHLCQRHSKFATHRPISASRGVRHGTATLRDLRMTPRGRRMPALPPRERRVPSGRRRWRGAIAAAPLPRPADAITA